MHAYMYTCIHTFFFSVLATRCTLPAGSPSGQNFRPRWGLSPHRWELSPHRAGGGHPRSFSTLSTVLGMDAIPDTEEARNPLGGGPSRLGRWQAYTAEPQARWADESRSADRMKARRRHFTGRRITADRPKSPSSGPSTPP